MKHSAVSINLDDNIDAINNRLTRQNDVLISLAKFQINSTHGLLAAIREMNEAASRTLGSDRTGIWFYDEDRAAVRCFDLYEREAGIHSHGKLVRIADFPRFFEMFHKERAVAIEDCEDDPRVAEFYDGYLKQYGIKSLLNSAVWVDGEVVGVVSHSQVRFSRRWTLDERNFITSVANTVAHWVDIAGRKEAENSLRAMQFSIDCAGDAILWVGPDAAIRYANEAASRMLGYSGPELLQMKLFDIAPRLTPQSWPRKWSAVKECGSVTYESTHLKKSGQLLPVEVSLNYFQYQGEEYQCAFVRDITERKFVQSELDRQRRFFRKVIDMNPNFIFAKDREGRFVLVNQAVADAYGTKVQELIGKTDADFNPNAAEVEHFRQDDLEVMDLCREKFVAEEKITDSEGRVRYLQTVKRPIVEDDGTVNQILGVSTDITDRKCAEEEQERLRSQMQHAQKLESLGVLAGGIAHDFNNLLMGIIGNATLAEAELPPQSPVLRRVQRVVTAARRAAELTNQLLAYSGRGKFLIEPTDLSALVAEMGTLVSTVISKKAELRYECAESTSLISVDASQVRQVVMNLLTNASDAVGEKAGTITVRTYEADLSADELARMYFNDELPPGRYVSLEVEDSGCGMDEHTLSRIFDPFFTTKFTGRGLGLAAVLGIVRSHRGALKVESGLGIGTKFSVLFPAFDEQSEDAHALPVKMVPMLQPQGLFLVVDDEETSRSVTCEMLQHFGYEVIVAHDGIQAVELFRKHAARLAGVLLDMTMPRMDGEETWMEISAIKPDIPVILMSGYSESEATSRFEGKKIAGFIQKPYQLEELRQKLGELLQANGSSVRQAEAPMMPA